MLVKLYVQNYALIKDLDVELEDGLTIITGETGAGKSILMGALSLILGSRADTSVLLEKNEKCVVEGTFRVDEYDLAEFFSANELDYETLTILRREINPAGKSRAFINDTPVTLIVLKEFGDRLIDIHSQHQTLMLNDNSFQLNVIDSFAGTIKLKAGYRENYFKYRKLEKEYNEAKGKAEKNKADLEYYQFQLRQFEDAKLVEGEQEELEKGQELLSHAEEIKLALSSLSGLFSDEDSSILSSLREAKNTLSRVKEFLPGGEELLVRAESSFIELNDLSSEIDKMAATIEADPHRLARINDRLDTIYSLIQKHRDGNLNDLINKQEEIRQMVSSIITGDERLTELETILNKEREKLTVLSDDISEKRKIVLPEAESKVTDLLKQDSRSPLTGFMISHPPELIMLTFCFQPTNR
jgi:DNA repair protein RecN (Recombination protein N)